MERSIDEVIRLLGDETAGKRLEGALACYDDPPVEVLVPLSEALEKEEDVKVRATLLKALAAVGSPESIPLIVRFLKAPDNRVRANAVEALASYEDRNLVPYFRRMLSDPHNRVRGNAMIALEPFAPKNFREAVNKLARSSLPSSCMTALYVLSKFEEPWAVSLVGHMALRPDNPLRWQTQKVLENMARCEVPGAYAALHAIRRSASNQRAVPGVTILQPPKVTRKNLSLLLEDPSPAVRIFAIQEASQRMDPGFVSPVLCRRLIDEQDAHVIATLTKWLGLIAVDDNVISRIKPFLYHPDARVRANTLEGLEGRIDPAVRRMAREKCDDPNPRVRAMAAKIIASHDRMKAFSILHEMMVSNDIADVSSALHALDKLEDRQIVELLEQGLLHGGDRIKSKVLNILRYVEDRVPLARRLRKRYEEGGFERYENEYIEEQLERLNSTDDSVRLEALERLRYCRSTRAWDYIEELAAGDRSVAVREMASRFVDACNAERRRRVCFHSFGLRILQIYEQGNLTLPQLFGLCRQIARFDRKIECDDGEDALEDLVIERRDTIIVLGERGWECYESHQLQDDVLRRIALELSSLGPNEKD